MNVRYAPWSDYKLRVCIRMLLRYDIALFEPSILVEW